MVSEVEIAQRDKRSLECSGEGEKSAKQTENSALGCGRKTRSVTSWKSWVNSVSGWGKWRIGWNALETASRECKPSAGFSSTLVITPMSRGESCRGLKPECNGLRSAG